MLPRILAVLLITAAVHAAPPGVSTIQTPGEATVYGLPTQFAIWVEKRVVNADLPAAMAAAEAFGEAFRAELTAMEIVPTEYNILAPALVDLPGNAVKAAVRLQISVGSLGAPDAANQRFAQICAQVAAAATKHEATLRGPLLEAANAEDLMRQAVAEAVSNAYPAAESAAAVLGEPIYAVDSVELVEVAWNAASETWDNSPSLRQLAVTAKVKVTYALGN